MSFKDFRGMIDELLKQRGKSPEEIIMGGDQMHRSPTGRIFKGPPMSFDNPLITDASGAAMAAVNFFQLYGGAAPILNVDYVALEERVLNEMGFMGDVTTISEWAKGEHPDLKVRFIKLGHSAIASYGEGSRLMREHELRAAGYRIETVHYRDYFNPLTSQWDRLTKKQAANQIPVSGTFTYAGRRPRMVEFTAYPDEPSGTKGDRLQEPCTHGGKTLVRVMTPYGYWAEGVAVCSEDDNYDAERGRKLALVKALIKLTEIIDAK